MQITFSITKPVGEITITSQNSQGAYIASEGDEKLWLLYPELRSLEFSPLPGQPGEETFDQHSDNPTEGLRYLISKDTMGPGLSV